MSKAAPASATVALPKWASIDPASPNVVTVDPDLAYPAILQEIAAAVDTFPGKPSKFSVETAYQVMKLDLQRAMGRYGFSIIVRADEGRAERWALANLPGSDADIARATKGRAARDLYVRVRGARP